MKQIDAIKRYNELVNIKSRTEAKEILDVYSMHDICEAYIQESERVLSALKLQVAEVLYKYTDHAKGLKQKPSGKLYKKDITELLKMLDNYNLIGTTAGLKKDQIGFKYGGVSIDKFAELDVTRPNFDFMVRVIARETLAVYEETLRNTAGKGFITGNISPSQSMDPFSDSYGRCSYVSSSRC